MSEHEVREAHLSSDLGIGISVALEVDEEVNASSTAVDGVGEFSVEPDSIRLDGGTGLGQQFADVGHHAGGVVSELAAVDQEHAFIVILRHGCSSLIWGERSRMNG